MDAAGFQGLFQTLTQLALTYEEVTFLQDWLAKVECPGECARLIEGAAAQRACPHCGHQRCHRYGHANGLQRYRCVACRRSFNALTGTPLARLRLRDKWLPYLKCLIESITVRAAAKRVTVANSTSFRWRHRFMSGVRREQHPQLSGIVEADETYHLESQKGSRHLDRPPRKRGGKATLPGISRQQDCILVARDRNKETYEFVTGRGAVNALQLVRHLKPVLCKDVLLVSDTAKAYAAFAKKVNVTHEMINVHAGVHSRGAIHIQNVNNWQSRFKQWLRRFNGVSSRYLASYTGWQRVLDAAVLTTPPHWLRVAVAPESLRDGPR